MLEYLEGQLKTVKDKSKLRFMEMCISILKERKIIIPTLEAYADNAFINWI